jgi:serine/threonine protein kinase
MSDHVIDVAGHMQKYAEPDTIFVAADLIRKSKVKRGFARAGTEVDGYDAYVWRGPSADRALAGSAHLVGTATNSAALTTNAANATNATVLARTVPGAIPTSLGKYEVRRELGRGAMGIVYEGWDPGIERRVALKTVRPDQLDSSEAKELAERFRREAQAAGQLSHPSIVSVYDFGQEADISFIAMEFIEGEELQDRLDRGERLTIPEVVEVMTQLLDALETAGRAGVVHRDIKPANIMVMAGDRVKIADFGIARKRTSEAGTQSEVVLLSSKLTAPHPVPGSGSARQYP